MLTARLGLAAAALASVAMAAVASVASATGFAPHAYYLPAAPKVTATCLLTERCDGTVSWPAPEGTLAGGSYSPLDQINTRNVARLHVAWTFKQTLAGGIEDYPVVIGGTAYLEGPDSSVYAVSANDGNELWNYVPLTGAYATAYGAESRGVAVGDGRVFLLTKDDHLIALEQKGGLVKWNVQVASAKAGYSESTPPLYVDGLVFVGSAGGDSAVRGFEEARSAATGKLVWIHYNTPGTGKGWVTSGAVGGGAVWMNPTVGPDGLLYFATGNPSPDLYGAGRPGANLWTDSIVAVNLHTGRQVWGYQMIAHDLWDYDSASPPVVFHTARGWIVGEADKGGYWDEVNALTGKPLTAPVAFVTENHIQPPPHGQYVLNWPGPLGGSEYSPVSYDPRTGDAYIQGNNIPAYETAAPVKAHVPGGLALGTAVKVNRGGVHTGTFTAVDVRTGTIAWQDTTPAPTTGGLITTAGGVAFGAVDNGTFEALDAATGKVLWSTTLPGSVGDAPVVYEDHGIEYLLIAVGGSMQFQYSKHPYQAEWIAYVLPRSLR